LHLGKSNCETKLAYSGENLSGAREYYDSLIAQGYPAHQALSYTNQHFPPAPPSPFQPNEKNQQNAMMLQNLQQPVMLENQQQPVIFAAPPPQSNNSALKIVVIIAGIIAFFMIITVVLAGVLYVWASDLANNNNQENAHLTGLDIQQEIGGKITIITVWVGENSTYVLVFEPAAGSEVIQTSDVEWQLICSNNDEETQIINGSFVGATDLNNTEISQINTGRPYMYSISAIAGSSDCSASGLGVGAEATFTVQVNGGGSTYEIFGITDTTIGAVV